MVVVMMAIDESHDCDVFHVSAADELLCWIVAFRFCLKNG